MKLVLHSQTSTIAPLNFGNRLLISSHKLWWMQWFIHAGSDDDYCGTVHHMSVMASQITGICLLFFFVVVVLFFFLFCFFLGGGLFNRLPRLIAKKSPKLSTSGPLWVQSAMAGDMVYYVRKTNMPPLKSDGRQHDNLAITWGCNQDKIRYNRRNLVMDK